MNISKTYLFLLVMFSCCLTPLQGVAQNSAFSAEVSQLKQMAEEGDIDAQVDLALKIEKGEGVRQDLKEAAKWYRKAAEQGSVDAQEKLRDMFNEDKKISKELFK